MTQDERVPTVLELRLNAAATPARVAAAAHLLDAMLRAVSPNLPDEEITMVVRNFSTKAGLRPRSPAARKAVNTLMAFLRKPQAETRKHPERASVAAAFVLNAPSLSAAEVEFIQLSRAKKPLATVDDKFMQRMTRLAEGAAPKPEARGETTICSPILRIGRTDEGQKLKIRVRLAGKPVDVKLPDHMAEEFFDHAKAGRSVTLRVAVSWLKDDNDRLVPDPKSVVLLRPEPGPQRGLSGESFLERIKALSRDAFDSFEDRRS